MSAAMAIAAWPFRRSRRLATDLVVDARELLVAHAKAVAVVTLLVTVGVVLFGLVLWAGERFAPPPVSFVSSVVPIAANFPMILAFALVGAVIAVRQPRNAIGWLFLAVGLISSFVPAIDFIIARANHAYVATPPTTVLLAWLASNFHLPMVGTIIIVAFLIFPEGRALPGRWTWAAWISVAGALLVGFGQALDPSGLRWYPTMPNPTAAPAWFAPFAIALQVAGLAFQMTALGIATLAMARRYRAYTTEERRGLFWVALTVIQLAAAGGALLVVRYGIGVPKSAGELVLTVTLIAATLVPIAAVDGMLRHRLFNIELVLTHALVYVPLTGFLAGLYAAAVALFTRIFVAVTGDSSDLVIVLSTLVLAGTFTPLRKALETFVDRHFKPAAIADGYVAPTPTPVAAPAPIPVPVSDPGPTAELDAAAELRELQARLARLERAIAEGR